MHATRKRKINWLVLLALPLLPPVQAADESWTLTAAEWSRPRSGAAVIAMPAVADAVRAWQAATPQHPQARLQLLYAGGEDGSLWAAELRDWLIALGLPAAAIEPMAAAGGPDRLEIRLAL